VAVLSLLTLEQHASKLLKTAIDGSSLNATRLILVPRQLNLTALPRVTNSPHQLTIAKSVGPLSTPVYKTAAVTRLARQHATALLPNGTAVTSARLPIVLPLFRWQRPTTSRQIHHQSTTVKSAGPPFTLVSRTAMATRLARHRAYVLGPRGIAAASASPPIAQPPRDRRPLMFLRYERPCMLLLRG
jgi:hypothetical protein